MSPDKAQQLGNDLACLAASIVEIAEELKAMYDFDHISIFHTDRGSEFANKAIDEVIDTFNIKRSLSKKGCPYDNAVAESAYNIIKTEFVFGEKFNTISELGIRFHAYVNWYNNERIHGSLRYLTPVEYRLTQNK